MSNSVSIGDLALIRYPLNRPGLVYEIVKWNENNRQISKHKYVINDNICMVYKRGTYEEGKKQLDVVLNLYLSRRTELRNQLLHLSIIKEEYSLNEPPRKRTRLN